MNRIADLPSRNWETTAPALIQSLTNQLRTSHGTQQLRDEQAVALHEMTQCNGAFLALAVGAGKTLIAGLAPVVMGARSPLLVTTGSLVDSTRHHLEQQALHWQIPHARIRIVSYQWLALRQNLGFFDLDPFHDLIVFDEAHRLKRVRKSSAARRFSRLFAAQPAVRVVAMSGTFCEDGIDDYAHIADWCLREDTPLPRTESGIMSLARALDPKVKIEEKPPLKRFASAYASPRSYSELKENFAIRLNTTPGVLISKRAYEASKLVIQPLQLPLPAECEQPMTDLRELNVAPDEWDLADSAETWSCARVLGLGYYHRHDPWPPEDWYDARRAYCKRVRQTIEDSDYYDTEAQVRDALLRGKLTWSEWDTWREIQPTFEVQRKTEWLSEDVLREVARYAAARKNLCIWSGHLDFSRRLSQLTGYDFYHSGGLNDAGESIEDASGTVIASIGACGTGKNLQQWSEALVVGMPTTTSACEQMIGRHYRSGQTAETVTITYLTTCDEHVGALRKAHNRALNVHRETRQPQILQRAEIQWPVGPKQ